MPAAIEPCAAIAGVRLKQAQSELTPLLRSRDNDPKATLRWCFCAPRCAKYLHPQFFGTVT